MLIRHIHLPTVISKFLPTLALTTVILIAPPSKSLGNYRELAVASLECDLDSVCSTFDENTEGWASVLGATGPQYIAAGGNPGGHICATDAASGGTRWFWKVPLAYLGDMSSAYNLTLRFDLKVSNFNVDFSEDVLLVGSGLTIAFDLPGDPVRDTWTSFDIELNETAGWTIQGSNEVPTQAQMQSVLGSLTDVLLRGDFAGGTTCLDNVTLDAPPSVFSPRTTFDSDTEDWAAVQGASFSHVSEGLIPPRGHVCATDAASGGTRWFWKASGEYLGDVSAGYDSALTFQIKQSVQGLIQAVNDVKLVGAGLTLTFDTYVNPGIDWTSYWVPLNESAGWKTEGGSLATQAELQAVLASLTDVFIRGDYGGGIGCLDDVDLEPPKTTTTLEPSYYFDADTEGWDVITNNSGVEWLPTGGNPRGHVCVTDSLSGGARWFWKMPLDGDVSSYYGKDLTFDLKQSVFGLTAFLDDVKLVSGPFTLIFDTSVNPGVDWTSYRVPLREGAGWKFEGAPSDLPPTKEEIQAVMSELSDLLIRGDYAGGQGCLDNVEFRKESANDGDSDGVFDSEDNCPQVSNSLQADADGDGIGDACECGDATGDGFVNTLDARLIQRFSTGQIPKPVQCDVTGEGGCNTIDARLIQRFAVGELNKADLQCAERP